MVEEFIITILWSLSPLGEAKAGIPHGLLNDLNPYLVLLLAIIANILVFPLTMFFLENINRWLTRWHWYKKSALWVAHRAKKGIGESVKKFGYSGLTLFVMIPFPRAVVYAGVPQKYSSSK
jgi:uncharacterized membrane protein